MQTSTATPADLDELKDSELLRRYVEQRCERSFTLLFDRWNLRLLNFIHSRIGDRDTAEELTQQTWERAFRHAHRFQWEKEFSSWIYVIAHNLAKNELRSRSRSHVTLYQRLRDKWDIHEGADRSLEWGDRSYAPDREAQKRELEDLVMKATAELKPQHRAVFVLAEFEDKSYEAISEITGVKLGTIKSRLNRARKHFRNALLDHGLAGADLDQLEAPNVDPPTEKDPININRAGAEKLCRLPGVSGAAAELMITARPFEEVDELVEVSGISAEMVEEIRPLVTLSDEPEAVAA